MEPRHTYTALFLFLLFLLLPTGAAGQSVTTAGPSWNRFTNKDGHGLYHDIIRQVYSDSVVKHLYVSSDQANAMVINGRADIKLCEPDPVPPLKPARYPMYESDYHVLFYRDKYSPWQGTASLAGKMLVWREGYYSPKDFPVPVQSTTVRSGESALQMILLDRADYYVDDITLIKQSFEQAGQEFDKNTFAIKKVGTRKYYPLFAATPHGEKLRIHFEKRFMEMYKDGSLDKIYRTWGFTLPALSFQ